ncbi:hypothetical protein GGI07_003878 [Coemansia sp. Benny D115]|nr:hypothetical protein GGI07_003878 [Coemansia sp. Benny D115]
MTKAPLLSLPTLVCLLLALVATTLAASNVVVGPPPAPPPPPVPPPPPFPPVLPSQHCRNGQRICVGDSNSGLYYLCNNNTWRLYTCGAGSRCAASGPWQATCRPTGSQCSGNQQRCNGGPNLSAYIACVNGEWQQRSCREGTRCINIPGNMINCQAGRLF